VRKASSKSTAEALGTGTWRAGGGRWIDRRANLTNNVALHPRAAIRGLEPLRNAEQNSSISAHSAFWKTASMFLPLPLRLLNGSSNAARPYWRRVENGCKCRGAPRSARSTRIAPCACRQGTPRRTARSPGDSQVSRPHAGMSECRAGPFQSLTIIQPPVTAPAASSLRPTRYLP
jgi:hypothetical protein